MTAMTAMTARAQPTAGPDRSSDFPGPQAKGESVRAGGVPQDNVSTRKSVPPTAGPDQGATAIPLQVSLKRAGKWLTPRVAHRVILHLPRRVFRTEHDAVRRPSIRSPGPAVHPKTFLSTVTKALGQGREAQHPGSLEAPPCRRIYNV